MAENNGGANQKRFSGDGNDDAAAYKIWKRWAKAAIVVQKVALAVENVDLAEINAKSGEELVFERLDERFPDKVAADRLGEAMEEGFSLKIQKQETTEAYTGRAQLVYARLAKEGVDPPPVARGYLILRGARLGSFGRARIMSATHRSWHVDEVCTALRTAFPGVPTETLAQATYAAEEEHGETDFPQMLEPYKDEGAEDDVTREIDAIVQAAEPIDESDAVEILATWKQTRVAMNREKLDRGLKCFRCKKIGDFNKDCKEPMPAHSSQMVFAECVKSDGERVQAVQDLQASNEREMMMAAEQDIDEEINSILKVHEDNVLATLIQDEDGITEKKTTTEGTVLGVTHSDGCSVPDTGCCKSLIGAETLMKHEAATGQKARWLKDAKQMRFRGFDNSVQESIGAVELDWTVKGYTVTFVVHVVQGPAGFLMSEPDLKALGAKIDLETDTMYPKKLDLTIPLNETAAGHYEIDLMNKEKRSHRQAGFQRGKRSRQDDVNQADDYNAMWKHIVEDEPYWVHMCPLCRKLSVLQQCTPMERRVDRAQHLSDVRWTVSLLHVVVEVAIYQLERGRHFLYETPPRCASLQVLVMKQLLQLPGVYVGVASGCAFGLRCPDTLKLMPKSWKFVTSAPEVAWAVQRRCSGGHEHHHTEGMLKCGIKQSVCSQRYPRRLVEAIKAAYEFYCPECEGMKCPKVAMPSTPAETNLPLKYANMDCKDMPGWISGERITCLGIVDEASSLHQVEPMIGMAETSKNLTDTFRQAWVRPYMRPKRLKVDPHRAQVSDEFTNWCERQGIEAADAAGGAKEQNGKIEHHNQLFDPRAQQARIRTIARMKLLMQQDKLTTRRALDSRPRVVVKYQPSDMVAVWRMMRNKGIPGKRAHHRWRPGIYMGEVRGKYWVLVDLEHYSGQRSEDITGGERLPETEVEAEPGGDQSETNRQHIGGIMYPPSLPSPPLIDSADAHLAEDTDENIVVGEVDVLLTQGSKEINLKDERWKSVKGKRMIEKACEKEMGSLMHETKVWRPMDLETSRVLETQVPERILRPRPVLTRRAGDDGEDEV
ncbi:unnamed protein product [Prorocentrum cordatum]|uniref:Integrase catalytic domain-containing protein n=1 Tax=Prorocentrum cordatum TaxID=2364126 RepID=A0ABN9V6D0_9DINO|nr:unnamed protein product [Polarella glacialis]